MEARMISATATRLERAEGMGRVVFGGDNGKTRLMELFQKAPSRFLFPLVGSHHGVSEVVLLNTAGGMASGDRFVCEVSAVEEASVAVSSQAAEKVYRAPEQPSRVSTRLTVSRAARLAWLPNETIVFNGARLIRRTELDLESGAEILALEWLVLGRAAHGERMRDGHVSDGWRVKRDGRLIWADTFRIQDESFPKLHQSALLADCRAMATLIYVGPHLSQCFDAFRSAAASLPCLCAATALRDLIVVRVAAKLAFDLKNAVRDLIQNIAVVTAPGPFRVPRMWSC
jgi:urease accessory protein